MIIHCISRFPRRPIYQLEPTELIVQARATSVSSLYRDLAATLKYGPVKAGPAAAGWIDLNISTITDKQNTLNSALQSTPLQVVEILSILLNRCLA